LDDNQIHHGSVGSQCSQKYIKILISEVFGALIRIVSQDLPHNFYSRSWDSTIRHSPGGTSSSESAASELTLVTPADGKKIQKAQQTEHFTYSLFLNTLKSI